MILNKHVTYSSVPKLLESRAWDNSAETDQTTLRRHLNKDLNCWLFHLHLLSHYFIVNKVISKMFTTKLLGVHIFKFLQ